MSRIKPCPDCRQEISTRAKKCPHCGRILHRDLISLIAKGFVALLIFLIVYAVASS